LAGSNPNIEIPEEVQKMIEDQGIKVFPSLDAFSNFV